MDRPTPPVSVVMSVHNAQPYLEEAIRSIRSQTLADFEFIVINDGSRDDSAAIIESHARHDPRLVVVHQENRGLIASLNRAVGMARAGIVARMDADDVALPSRLEVQLDAMRRERPALVSCAFEIVTADGRVRAVKDTYPDADLAPWFMLFYNFVAGHSQVMFDRDLAVEAGLYDVDDLHVEDYGLWVRLLRKGRFVALPQVLHRYRFHDASVSRTNMAAQTEGLVTLARGQLVDLGLELSREDVRSLQRFWLSGRAAAYRTPQDLDRLDDLDLHLREAYTYFCLGHRSEPGIWKYRHRIRQRIASRYVQWSRRLPRRAWRSRGRVLRRAVAWDRSTALTAVPTRGRAT